MVVITELDTTYTAPKYNAAVLHSLYRSVYTTVVPFSGSLFGIKQPSDHVLLRCNSSLLMMVRQRTSQLPFNINVYPTYTTDMVYYPKQPQSILVTIYSSFNGSTIAMVQYIATENNINISNLTLNDITL